MKTGYTEREGRVGGFESVDKLLIDNVNLVLPDIRQTVHLIQPQTRHISKTHAHTQTAGSLFTLLTDYSIIHYGRPME